MLKSQKIMVFWNCYISYFNGHRNYNGCHYMIPYQQNWAISKVQTTNKSPFIKCDFYNCEIQHIFNK